MSACPEMEGLIAERASGELKGEEGARLDAHLESCEACKGELRSYQELFLMARLPAAETRVAHLDVSTFAAYQRSRRRRVTGWTIGAGLAAAAAAAAVVIVPAALTLRSLPRPAAHGSAQDSAYAYDVGYADADSTSAPLVGTYQQQGQGGTTLAMSTSASDEVLPEDAALAAFDEVDSL